MANEVREMKAAGIGATEIAKALGIGRASLAQLYQLAPSNGNFLGVPAQKRESNQQPPIANRL